MGAEHIFQGQVILSNPVLGEAVTKTKKIHIIASNLAVGSGGAAVAYDTSWDLPAKAIVRDVWVDVTTAEVTGSTKTIDIGTKASEAGGDADGFFNDASVSSTGLKVMTLSSDGVTRGVLLRATAAATGATVLVPKDYPSTANTAKSIVVTAGTSDFAELVCDVFIKYDEVQTL